MSTPFPQYPERRVTAVGNQPGPIPQRTTAMSTPFPQYRERRVIAVENQPGPIPQRTTAMSTPNPQYPERRVTAVGNQPGPIPQRTTGMSTPNPQYSARVTASGNQARPRDSTVIEIDRLLNGLEDQPGETPQEITTLRTWFNAWQRGRSDVTATTQACMNFQTNKPVRGLTLHIVNAAVKRLREDHPVTLFIAKVIGVGLGVGVGGNAIYDGIRHAM
jgi:hypothetical protein